MKTLNEKRAQKNKDRTMDIEINPNEVIAEMQRRFPKELEICVQSVQIRKMGELLEDDTDDE